MTIDQVVAIAQRIHDAEGYRLGSGSTREYRNAFWARAIGVVHHGHPIYNPTPDPQWHLKDGGGGRPQSDDVAVSMPSRQFWDCIGGVGADGYRFGASGHPEILPPEQNVYPPPVPAGVGATPPPPVTDAWTSAHQDIWARIRAKGSPDGDPFVLLLAEQLAYAFPDESWGTKKTRAGSPISQDVIALRRDGVMTFVRVVPSVTVLGQNTDQVFIEAVPFNHLGDTPVDPPPVDPPEEPIDPPPPAPVDVAAVAAAVLAALEPRFAKVAADLEDVRVLAARAATQRYNIRADAGWLGTITGTVSPEEPPR